MIKLMRSSILDRSLLLKGECNELKTNISKRLNLNLKTDTELIYSLPF